MSAQEIREELSYTHKKEFAESIEEAKKAETKTRQIEKTVSELSTEFNKVEITQLKTEVPNK